MRAPGAGSRTEREPGAGSRTEREPGAGSRTEREPGAGSRTVRGATLIELTVALTILGITLAVAGLGARSLTPSPQAEAVRALESARRQAIETGAATTVSRDGRAVRFAPDGSARGGPLVTDSLVGEVDPLTGVVHASRR